MKKFKLDLNLDDANERADFLDKYGITRGRRLAKLLGLKGAGSAMLADALSNFAWNAYTAYNLRMGGDVPGALIYEDICNRIYDEDVRPICECW